MKRYDEFQRHNVFCRPDWRMERVLQLVDHFPSPARCSRRDDRYIREARRFILRYRQADADKREELFFQQPGLYYAYQIHERSAQEPEPALFMQARLLARQSFEEIGHYLGTIPDTVEWYAKLFFDVTERLDHRDWITKQVLLPALVRSATAGEMVPWIVRPFLDGTLKMFAYFGGPLVADVMINGFLREPPPKNADQLGEWFDRQWSLTMRRRSQQAAAVFDINRYNVMALFQIHREIMDSDRAVRSTSKQRDELYETIESLLESAPVCSGYVANRWYKQQPLGEADEQALELRDHELHLVQTGHAVQPDGPPGGLPPPRPAARIGPPGDDV